MGPPPRGGEELRTLLEVELARCDRYHHPLTLVRLDLEDPSAADGSCARAALCAALDGVRTSDAAFELDPGAFALVLPETPGIAARHVAHRLRHAVRLSAPEATVRVGIAEAHGTDLDGLLHRADPALPDGEHGPFA